MDESKMTENKTEETIQTMVSLSAVVGFCFLVEPTLKFIENLFK